MLTRCFSASVLFSAREISIFGDLCRHVAKIECIRD